MKASAKVGFFCPSKGRLMNISREQGFSCLNQVESVKFPVSFSKSVKSIKTVVSEQL